MVRAGIAIAVVAVVAQTVAHLVNGLALDGSQGALDATGDDNAFAWFTATATVASAVGATSWAAARREGRGALVVLAACVSCLALDDVAQGHERIEHAVAGAGGVPGDRAVLALAGGYAALLAITALLLAFVSRRAPSQARLAIAGGVLLLAGSVGVRLAGAAVELGGARLEGTGKVVAQALMQDAKLAGWTLVAAGLGAAATWSRRRATRP